MWKDGLTSSRQGIRQISRSTKSSMAVMNPAESTSIRCKARERLRVSVAASFTSCAIFSMSPTSMTRWFFSRNATERAMNATAVRCWQSPSCISWPRRCCSRSLISRISPSKPFRRVISSCNSLFATRRSRVRSRTRSSNRSLDFRSASSAFLRSVISMATTTADSGLPVALSTGVLQTLIQIAEPSLRR